jgi:hypothetical protein
MLSVTKHLGPRVRFFAEFTLSETNVLRMTILKNRLRSGADECYEL